MSAYPLESWRELLPALGHWNRLPLPLKQVARKLPPVYQVLDSEWKALPEDLFAAFFEKDASGHHRPRYALRGLLGLIEQLSSWSKPDNIDITLYVQQNTNLDQRYRMTGLRRGMSSDIITAAFEKRLLSGWFAKTLIASDTAPGFLSAINLWRPEGMSFGKNRYEPLKAWLQNLIERKYDSFFLTSETLMAQQGQGQKKQVLPAEEILCLALDLGLAVVALLPHTLEPVVQMLFPSTALQQRPDNLVLKKVKNQSRFARPFILDDIDVFLRSLKSGTTPLLINGSGVPLAHLRKVAKLFIPLPSPIPRVGFEAEDRAQAAWWHIDGLNYQTPSGGGRKGRIASLNKRGEDYLSLSREEKMDVILGSTPLGRRVSHNIGIRFSFMGDFEAIPFPYEALTDRVMEWMDEAVIRLTEPVDFLEWTQSATKGFNPFLADVEQVPGLDGHWARWESSPPHVYYKLLTHYLARLASLGAVALDKTEEGNLGVSLTSIGQYLFNLSEDWEMPKAEKPIAMVGADYSILLLESSPSLALELKDFAEPVGSAFRLTRKSIQGAVHRGMSGEEILLTLKACAKNGVPANVSHEIKAWAKSKQNVKLHEAILVEGEDEIVMAEILSLFPKDFQSVSPTMLKYVGTGKLSLLEKRLEKKGFYPE